MSTGYAYPPGYNPSSYGWLDESPYQAAQEEPLTREVMRERLEATEAAVVIIQEVLTSDSVDWALVEDLEDDLRQNRVVLERAIGQLASENREVEDQEAEQLLADMLAMNEEVNGAIDLRRDVYTAVHGGAPEGSPQQQVPMGMPISGAQPLPSAGAAATPPASTDFQQAAARMAARNAERKAAQQVAQQPPLQQQQQGDLLGGGFTSDPTPAAAQSPPMYPVSPGQNGLSFPTQPVVRAPTPVARRTRIMPNPHAPVPRPRAACPCCPCCAHQQLQRHSGASSLRQGRRRGPQLYRLQQRPVRGAADPKGHGD